MSLSHFNPLRWVYTTCYRFTDFHRLTIGGSTSLYKLFFCPFRYTLDNIFISGVLIMQNWEGIKGGAKLLWEDVSMFFSRMIDSVVAFGQAVLTSVLSPFRQAKELITGFGSSIGSFLSFGETELKAEQNINRQSQTDVNVNLRAPERTIESVKTSTSGKMPGLNVGVNMEAAG